MTHSAYLLGRARIAPTRSMASTDERSSVLSMCVLHRLSKSRMGRRGRPTAPREPGGQGTLTRASVGNGLGYTGTRGALCRLAVGAEALDVENDGRRAVVVPASGARVIESHRNGGRGEPGAQGEMDTTNGSHDYSFQGGVSCS